MFTIVKRFFDPAEFAAYAMHVPTSTTFDPSRVVLHNTAVPNLSQRPRGFVASSMDDLQHYYADVQGWDGGPHLFVDDLGIWVFNPLDRRGVHSPSWNASAYGVEMLGDYSVEEFETGRGAKVQRNAVEAVAALFARMKRPATEHNFVLHKEDPKTTHKGCPGMHVDKGAFLAKVVAAKTQVHDAADLRAGVPVVVVVYRKGHGQEPAARIVGNLVGGTVYADEGELRAALFDASPDIRPKRSVPVRDVAAGRFVVTWKPETMRVYLGEK